MTGRKFKVVIIYEDIAAGKRAKHFYDRVIRELVDELDFSLERWNFQITDNKSALVPVNPSAGSFIQDLMPLLTNYDSMKMSIDVDQFSYVEKLATLTQLYLELRLPLHDALRAAEADL